MEFVTKEKNENEKAAWLEKRKHYITGTDAGQIIGVSPWGGIFAVWLDKTGRGEPVLETPAMAWGKRNEENILRAYAEEMNCKLEHVDGYDLKTCDKFPRLGASLDGWNHNLGIPVDAKNIKFKNEKWGDAWTSDFPEYYKAQLQVQMMVTGAPYAHLAVLFSGQDFFIYQMEYDEELAQRIIDATDAFWPYVEHDEMPDADGSDKTTDYIKSEYSVGHADEEKAATDEILETVKELKIVKAQETEIKNRKTELENKVKAYMGKATIIPFVCTWKNNKDSVETDWEAVARAAMAEMGEDEQKELIKANTTTTAGARVLRITAK